MAEGRSESGSAPYLAAVLEDKFAPLDRPHRLESESPVPSLFSQTVRLHQRRKFSPSQGKGEEGLAHPDDDQPVFRDGDAFPLAQRRVAAPVGPAGAHLWIAAVLHHPEDGIRGRISIGSEN